MTRQSEGKRIRNEARDRDYPNRFPLNRNNGEEEDAEHNRKNYRNYIANYSKSLPHYDINNNNAGEVKPDAYKKLLHAVDSEDPNDFEKIPVGNKNPLTNPLSGLSFDLEGLDSHATYVPPAPRIDSPEAAGEVAELYWMVLCRDVHFNDFGTDIEIQHAVDDLSTNYSKFPLPKNSNTHPVTTKNIFRGFTKGDVTGPYLSQFLLLGSKDVDQDSKDGYIKYGCQRIDQRQLTVMGGKQNDYLTKYQDWLDVQDGTKNPADPNNIACGNNYDTLRRFIRNMRDLANYVHYDDLPQEFINACLILLHFDPPCKNPRADFDPQNPYMRRYKKQVGFGTFGPPHILTLVTEVTTRALKAAWYHKWFVHRRLRPEAFGGLIHRQKTTTRPPSVPNPSYPIHNEILNSEVLNRINADYGSYLLPQVFQEGSPTHPSYPAGHATIAGACVTILKAFFMEDYKISQSVNPVVASIDGTALVDYNGPDKDELTIRGELDKLAANIAIGRNMAGVHYRSDYTQSLLLGEQIACSILEDQEKTYREKYCIKFHKFDGSVYHTGSDCRRTEKERCVDI